MERRKERQIEHLEMIEQLALADLGKLDNDEEDYSDLEWSGVGSGNFPDVLESFIDYRERGVLPVSGGKQEQHPLWQKDIRQITRWYNYFYQQHKDRDING